MISKNTKVAIYARVSTEEQTENFSLAAQIELLKKYANEHGYQVYKEYIDGGFSGTTLDRPAFKSLLDDARQNCFELILVYRLDRFFRNNRALLTVADELEQLKVGLKSITEPFDTSNHMGKFMLSLLGSLAQLERDSFMERSKMGRIRRATEGNYSATEPKFGYTISEDRKKLIICPKESEIVKLMFDTYIEADSSLTRVARKLNSLGYRTRKGNEWTTDRVHDMVRDSIYIGQWYANRYGTKGLKPKDEWIQVKVPAFISEDVFQKAQELLNKRRNYTDRRVGKYQYLLAGFVKCGDCGHNVTGDADKQRPLKNGKLYGPYFKLYYRCSHFFRNIIKRTVNCNLRYLQAEPFEDTVWKEIEKLLTNPGLVEKALETQKNPISEKKLEKERLKIESRLKSQQKEEQRLIEAYQANVISLNQLKAQKDQIQVSSEALNARITEIESLLASSKDSERKDAINYVEKVKQGIDKFTFENKRKVLHALKTKIVVNLNGVIDIVCSLPTTDINFLSSDSALVSSSPSARPISWLSPDSMWGSSRTRRFCFLKYYRSADDGIIF